MSEAISATKIENLAHLGQLSREELIAALINGFPAQLARELADALGVTMVDMAGLLRMNPRTLQRRLDDGSLELGESERLWELYRLFARAEKVLESREGAIHWFKNPIQALGWATPLAYARTSVGLRELDNILGRIEHGVYS
jgi:putative toxin-antitoxin system antitoxin component (TIGR02293 family)